MDRTDGHTSVNLIYHTDEYAEEKTAEHNLIKRIGKSEAEVTNNKIKRSRYRTARADYRQTKHRAASLCQQTRPTCFRKVEMVNVT